jgi:hypothetical protein
MFDACATADTSASVIVAALFTFVSTPPADAQAIASAIEPHAATIRDLPIAVPPDVVV